MAHAQLVSSSQRLRERGQACPNQLMRTLMLLHSYILVKTLVRMADHQVHNLALLHPLVGDGLLLHSDMPFRHASSRPACAGKILTMVIVTDDELQPHFCQVPQLSIDVPIDALQVSASS